MRPEDRLRQAWRTWLEEPPRLTGASAVEAAQTSALRVTRRRRIGAVLVLTITLLAGGFWLQRSEGPPAAPDQSAEGAVLAVDHDVVVLPLDERTRLYLVLPPRQKRGGAT